MTIGALVQLVGGQEGADWSASMLADLWDGGLDGSCAGVVAGLLAQTLELIISRAGAVIVLLAALALCLCPRFAGAAPHEDMPTVKTFAFSCSGMSVDQMRSYQIRETKRGRLATIELYLAYTFVLPVTDAELAAFSALLDELDLAAWDGYRQEDSTVLDGESFSLNVAFEDGSGIDAVGTNSFPDGYYEKKGAIQAFFEALMREYEIDADKIGYW